MALRPETLKQREAFEYFYALGDKRTYGKVAKYFNVTERTVINWSQNYNWKKRVRKMDLEIAEQMDRKMIDNMANIKSEFVDSLYMVFKHSVMDKFKEGKIPVEVKNVKDMETIIKLILKMAENEVSEEEAVSSEITGLNDEDRDALKVALGALAMGGVQSDSGNQQFNEIGDDEEGTVLSGEEEDQAD